MEESVKKVFFKTTIILLIVCTLWNILYTNSLASNAQIQISDGSSSSSLGPTSGHTVEEAGETLAAWAINFYNLHRDQCNYNGPKSYDEPVSDDDLTTQYYFDCVAFVTFAIHHALGLEGSEFVKCPYHNSGYGPEDENNKPLINNGFEQVYCSSSEWQPGDIIVMHNHVAVYVGDGKTVGMWIAGLQYIDALSDCNSNGGYEGWVGRISAETAASAVFEYMVGAGSGGVEGLDGPTTSAGVEVDEAEVDLDELAEQFTFDGIAPTIIYVDQEFDLFRWLFDGISGFMDFIAGTLISFIKAPIVGFAGIVDLMVDTMLNDLN